MKQEMPAPESFAGRGGLQLLPKRFPGGEWLGPYAEMLRSFEDKTKVYSDDELRAIHWTIALENAFENSDLVSAIPGFRMATYGFADPQFEEDAFGIILYTVPFASAPFPEIAEPSPKPDPFSPYTIVVDEIRFPAFIRRAEPHWHSPGVHPRQGTAACWARSKKPPLASLTSLLTAKHILENVALGNPVPLTAGQGHVIDVAPEGVDAALVQVPGPYAAGGGKRLRSRRLVAQWTDVEIHKQQSVISTKVIEVNSSRGSLHYSLPLRIFLGHSGQPGDSGSLVMTPGGVGIGMYLGSVVNPATQQSEGFCQHLAQAANALSVQLFL
jgi:hypothetical protein